MIIVRMTKAEHFVKPLSMESRLASRSEKQLFSGSSGHFFLYHWRVRRYSAVQDRCFSQNTSNKTEGCGSFWPQAVRGFCVTHVHYYI